jgi:hypothetical protein
MAASQHDSNLQIAFVKGCRGPESPEATAKPNEFPQLAAPRWRDQMPVLHGELELMRSRPYFFRFLTNNSYRLETWLQGLNELKAEKKVDLRPLTH